MVKATNVLAALALAAWTVTPVLAEDFTPVDVNSVTCAGFMAMETPERNDVSYHVLRWIGDANNAVAAQKLIPQYGSGKVSTEDLTIGIEGHCKDAAPETGIIARLIEHT